MNNQDYLENYRKIRADDSEKLFAYFKKQPFNKGVKTEDKLNSALNGDYVFLRNRTLLTDSVHQDHSQRVEAKLLKKWDKLCLEKMHFENEFSSHRKKSLEHAIAENHLRFVTIIDSLAPVDGMSALERVVKFREKIKSCIESVSGLWCIGAVELEVVPMKLMRRVYESNSLEGSEKRKFQVCTQLKSSLDGTLFENDESYFLIHYHGVVFAKSKDRLAVLDSNLRSEDDWKLAPRQVEVKQLSESFDGKPKPIKKSLSHIARYITKGGMDMFGGNRYFRYKLNFSYGEDGVSSEEEWVARNWRSDPELKSLNRHEGIDDMMSLNRHEIEQLAVAIDAMMGLNATRTGYLVVAGK